nr:MAG TPA: homing endonuclease [Caudoviricetes sp.]
MKTEIWKRVIEENIGEYEVSNMGNVRNAVTGRVLKPFTNTAGYQQVDLTKYEKDKKQKKRLFLVHRLVANVFVDNDNPIEKTQANHLDENPKNNRADNLSWTTPKENSNYGTRTKRIAEKHQKEVQQIDKVTGQIIYTFGSVKEATEKTGIESISACARGKLKTSGGYLWRYTA